MARISIEEARSSNRRGITKNAQDALACEAIVLNGSEKHPGKLTHSERAFIDLVRKNPGAKLNGPEAYSSDGEPLWIYPEKLGMIESVGSYKWKVSA